MAKPTPAMITYKDSSASPITRQIRFHSVIMESHKAKSVSTSYPVSTGFEVSRHTIKKNRQITIKAIVSNVLFENGNNVDVVTTNTVKTIHEACAALVDNGLVCRVVSNLGIYDPVVFNDYETKTEAGYVDSTIIILKGEQKQVKGSLNKTAPVQLSFAILDESTKSVRLAELEQHGYYVDAELNDLYECTMPLGTDFSVETLTENGDSVTNTFEVMAQDPTTGAYTYKSHRDLEEVYAPTPITDKLDTELGQLEKSSYGVFYETTDISDVTPLPTMGNDLIIAGVSDIPSSPSPDDFDSVPTADEISSNIHRAGNGSVNGGIQTLTTTTFTKVTPKTTVDELGNVL